MKKKVFFLAQIVWCCSLFLGASCQEKKLANQTNGTVSNFRTQSNDSPSELTAIDYCKLLEHHFEYEEKTVELKTMFLKGQFVDVFYDENCITPSAQVRVEFMPNFQCAENNLDDPSLCQLIVAKPQESERVFKKFRLDAIGKLIRVSESERANERVSDLPSWRFVIEKVVKVREITEDSRE